MRLQKWWNNGWWFEYTSDDYAIEESLETIFDLAEEFQVGIDITCMIRGKLAFIQLSF